MLPLPVLAGSELPAADAARVVLPKGGAVLVTVISLMTVISLVNATLLMAPRILSPSAATGCSRKRPPTSVEARRGWPWRSPVSAPRDSS